MKKNIAVVVPTIRQECIERFRNAWLHQFTEHDVEVLTVYDGEYPRLNVNGTDREFKVPEETVFNYNDGVRNLGFAYVAKHMAHVDYIVTLDDDTEPCGDTIGDHIKALSSKVPISWMSTADRYMRGFPYAVREEADVWVSHGVWIGVPDYDAPTQLVNGTPAANYFRGPVPKGALIPVCGMNLAFRRAMLPFMYFAPMGPEVGIHRFADIWMGINMKRVLDKMDKALVTGCATVQHNRASNVFKNLEQEAKGLKLNETFWQGDETAPYFKLYNEAHKRWMDFLNEK